jgi:hypothetical protein
MLSEETQTDGPVLCDDTISDYTSSEVIKAVIEGKVIDITNSLQDDWIKVRMPIDGSRWKFTWAQWDMLIKQAADSNGSLPEAPIKEITHVLYHGAPLCAFTADRPCDWPKGHWWVPLAEDMKDKRIDNICKACNPVALKLAQELFGWK